MSDRFVLRSDVLEAEQSFEIIEAYPEDKYLPSYLVYGRKETRVIHVLFAVDVEGNNIRVVTAYYPNQTHWKKDYKTRRKA